MRFRIRYYDRDLQREQSMHLDADSHWEALRRFRAANDANGVDLLTVASLYVNAAGEWVATEAVPVSELDEEAGYDAAAEDAAHDGADAWPVRLTDVGVTP